MSTLPVVRRVLGVMLSGAIALGVAVAPHSAQAWWRGPGYGWGGWHGGFSFGFVAPPIYLGPPVTYYAAPAYPAPYYAPPVYAPPVYAPAPYPPAYAGPAAQGCYAGPYVCPLTVPAAVGGPCSCPANNGRVYGRAG